MKPTPKDTKQAEANRLWRGDTATPKDKALPFEKLLIKENYTKQEVNDLLRGTYEGFSKSLFKILDKHKQEIADTKRQTIKECIKIINDIETPYPKEFVSNWECPTTQEGKNWKFGNLVCSNTKEDIIKEIKDKLLKGEKE